MSDERDTGGRESRRTFLKVGTAALGGGIMVVVAAPLARYVYYPVGRDVVSSPDEPIDIGLLAEELEAGAAPVKVELIAGSVRDGWNLKSGVAVGAAWVRKSESGEISAFTSTCPHLGCSIEYQKADGVYRCPCHDSAFAIDGARQTGPAKRGLDPLPVQVDEEGRVKLTFKRFRQDIEDRVEV